MSKHCGEPNSKYKHVFKSALPVGWLAVCGAVIRNNTVENQKDAPPCPRCTTNRPGNRRRARSLFTHECRASFGDHWQTWCGARIYHDTPVDKDLPPCPYCADRRARGESFGGILSVTDAAKDSVWSECFQREDGCWEYHGREDKRGRGKIKRGGRTWMVTRWIYALAHGGLPDGIFIIHTCNHSWCVNPDHLKGSKLPELAGYISQKAAEGVIARFRGTGEPFGVESNHAGV